MFERLVENWLTSINEEGYQLPFCHLLQAEGHRVVHLSRHGPAEQGKDVLAIAADDVAWAYQLKGPGTGGRITLREWERYAGQIARLVELPITHPSVPADSQHRPCFVTNGELDEPVRQEIADRNRVWKARGYAELEVITKGGLLTRFQALQSSFWPQEPRDVKLLLELFLDEGDGYLDKASLWDLLEIELSFEAEKLTSTQYRRSTANAGILCAHALAPYLRRENHVAVIEGWTLYLAACLSLAEKHSLPEAVWRPVCDLSQAALEDALQRLWDEVRQRTDFVEGSALEEAAHRAFFIARMTWVAGLLSVWGLWLRSCGDGPPDELLELLQREQRHLKLSGEGDVPKFLAYLWLLRKTLATPEPDAVLRSLIQTIAGANGDPDGRGLPDPYHTVGEVLHYQVAADDEWDEEFSLQSYSLEALVLLYARRGWRQDMAALWPAISRVSWCHYQPQAPWLYYSWDTDNRGALRIRTPPMRQSWALLKESARTINLDSIPRLLQTMPAFLLLFVVVCPHRLTPDVARLLDGWVDSLPHLNQSA